MKVETRFNTKDTVIISLQGVLEKVTIVGIDIKVLPEGTPCIEYKFWTGTETLRIPENMVFADEAEVRADFEKRLQKLSN